MLVIANWKQNPASIMEAESLFSAMPKKDSVVICPPYPFLYQGKRVTLGAQDCSPFPGGSFTGEVSAEMLRSFGCLYVIVGHSERKEDKELVKRKASAAVSKGIVPVICMADGDNIEDFFVEGGIVAYEPVSSIGTGKPCPVPEAKRKREEIRSVLGSVPVIYGGSVDENNICDYTEHFEGVLVGGASLDAQKFKKIIEKCDQKN